MEIKVPSFFIRKNSDSCFLESDDGIIPLELKAEVNLKAKSLKEFCHIWTKIKLLLLPA